MLEWHLILLAPEPAYEEDKHSGKEECRECESLFSSDESTLIPSCAEPTLKNIDSNIVKGDVQIVFAHPEALLSKEGRNLMNSEVFKNNVVACVVDEAYCVEIWGEEFRTEFKDLAAVKAFFPKIPIMALTATAPPAMLTSLKLSLSSGYKVISPNPNRRNIYFDKKVRMSGHRGYTSYEQILLLIANQLSVQREKYPMTIIYLKLKYCRYAFSLFERVLKDQQFVGDETDPSAQLFAQFHAPQTTRMKKSIIAEIKKKDSRVRVLFATSALGMGVNAPYVEHVVHVTPPSNLESYVQETGCAGRTGTMSCATLYYNNSDIGANKKHVHKAMKDYCRSQDTCLRNLILQHLGFPSVEQTRRCCICDGTYKNVAEKVTKVAKPIVRALPSENRDILSQLILFELDDSLNDVATVGMNLFDCSVGDNRRLVDEIIEGIECVKTEADLLETYKIWNERCSSHIICHIDTYAPLIGDSQN